MWQMFIPMIIQGVKQSIGEHLMLGQEFGLFDKGEYETAPGALTDEDIDELAQALRQQGMSRLEAGSRQRMGQVQASASARGLGRSGLVSRDQRRIGGEADIAQAELEGQIARAIFAARSNRQMIYEPSWADRWAGYLTQSGEGGGGAAGMLAGYLQGRREGAQTFGAQAQQPMMAEPYEQEPYGYGGIPRQELRPPRGLVRY